MEKEKVLLTTLTGSHVWNMQTPESDKDYWTTYLHATKEVLNGTFNPKHSSDSKSHKGGAIDDVQKHELQKTLEYCAKGNINFIIGVTSPCVIEEHRHPLGTELRNLVKLNPVKEIVHSIYGTAIQNMARRCHQPLSRKQAKKDPKLVFKNLRQHGMEPREINKVIRFTYTGIETFQNEAYTYPKITSEHTIEELIQSVSELKQEYAKSTMPEKIDDHVWKEFLLKARLGNL